MAQTARLVILMEPDDKAALIAEAMATGMNLSDLVRRKALGIDSDEAMRALIGVAKDTTASTKRRIVAALTALADARKGATLPPPQIAPAELDALADLFDTSSVAVTPRKGARP